MNQKIYKVRLVSYEEDHHRLESIQIMEYIPTIGDTLLVPVECFDSLSKKTRYGIFARTKVIAREYRVGLNEPIVLKLEIEKAWVPQKVIKPASMQQ